MDSSSSWKGILKTLTNNSIKDIERTLELILKQVPVDPNFLAYTNIRKYLGVIKFRDGDMFASAYNFQESLGPAVRTYASKIISHKLKNDELFTVDEKKFEKICKILDTNEWADDPLVDLMKDDFINAHTKTQTVMLSKWDKFLEGLPYNSNSNSIDRDLKKVIEELPAEWTIVQITKAPDQNDMVGPVYNSELTNTPVYATIFSGDHINLKNQSPITICIKPCRDTKFILSELLKEKELYLSEKKEKRCAAFENFKALLFEFEEIFGSIASLFLGKLKSNQEDYKIICRHIDDCITEHGLVITESQRILLYRLAPFCSYAMNLQSINYALQSIFSEAGHAQMREIFLNFFKKYFLSEELCNKNMKNAKRGPTILIVDQALDLIPWEVLKCFEMQSVTRVHSLHFLQALHFCHKDNIRDGYFMVDEVKGGYILDKAQDLKSMQVRIKAFVKYWLPNWTCGNLEKEITTEEFSDILQNNTIFYYAGHGGGQKFLSYDILEKRNISCVALLSGCSSVSLRKLGMADEYGLHLSYHLAGSPCIVGNLWSVSDRDCDRIMCRLISTWVPGPKNVKHFMHCNVSKWDVTGVLETNNLSKPAFPNQFIGPLYPNTLSEPDLQRAVSISRGYAVSVFSKCAMIVRGLPTKLKI